MEWIRHAVLLRKTPFPYCTMQPHAAQPDSVSPKGGGLGGVQPDLKRKYGSLGGAVPESGAGRWNSGELI